MEVEPLGCQARLIPSLFMTFVIAKFTKEMLFCDRPCD